MQTLPSDARPAICSKLERQLANAGASGGSAKFAKAAASQARQLQVARGQSRANGCVGGLFSKAAKTPACNRITSTIRKMEANLVSLRSKSSGLSASTGRSRILAALSANDCNKLDAKVQQASAKRELPKAAKREQGFMTLLFGGQKVERRPAGSGPCKPDKKR